MNISLLRDIPLCIGVLIITGLWVFYVAVLVEHPEILEISDDMFFINLWYAICAVGTTLVAYIETAKYLQGEENPDTSASLCTPNASATLFAAKVEAA
jgi:hypothetical protein